MATYQANRRNIARQDVGGSTVVVSTFTWTATASVGDVIQFCRLPNNSTVVRAAVYGVGGADHVNFGTDSDIDRFYASSSGITVLHESNRPGVGIGYLFSASADTDTRYEYVRASIVVVDSSVTESITTIVEYVTGN